MLATPYGFNISISIKIGAVRVKEGMSLWHGMWHDLRNGIIMRNVILAE